MTPMKGVAFGFAVLCDGARDIVDEWHEWQQTHMKDYSSEDDMGFRFNLFAKNAARVAMVNDAGLSYTLTLNEFAADTVEEQAARMGLEANSLRVSGLAHLGLHTGMAVDVTSIDWRTKGVVNPVKDQGKCGSCWAFSIVGALESHWAMKSGSLMSLAEQQLVDCDDNELGCGGGALQRGYMWVKDQALCKTSSYPYEAKHGTCRAAGCDVAIATGNIVGYYGVDKTAYALKSAIANGPVTVAVAASSWDFQGYESGVVTGTSCGLSLNHGVVAVGFGVETSIEYFLVRNSWGASWGDNGYIKLGTEGNVCGILNDSDNSFVKFSGDPPNPPEPPVPVPVPTPPPTPVPSLGHYGAPPCLSDETTIGLGKGLSVCAVSCSKHTCPMDVPEGVRRSPQCFSFEGIVFCGIPCDLDSDCPSSGRCSSFFGACAYNTTVGALFV